MIIDNLVFDDSALATCAAVCREWLPSSHSRLFRSLRLHPQNSKAFLELLDSPFTTIAPYVLSLAIFGDERQFQNQRGWVGDALLHLTCLVGVRTLRLEEVHWKNVRTESKNALKSSFKQITQLWLRYVSFDEFEELVDLLCSFPLLEHIQFNDIIWPEATFLTSTPKRLPACFRYLDLRYCSSVEKFIESLFPHHSTYSVDTLYLSYFNMQDVHPIAAFLRNLGHNLHHLRLNLCRLNGGETESFCNILDLVHNDQLRSIRVLHNIRYKYKGMTGVDWIAMVLSQIVSEHMEVVELSLSVMHDAALDLVDWSLLAKTFAEPRLAALRWIRIKVLGSCDVQRAESTVRKGLPHCEARGILDFPRFL